MRTLRDKKLCATNTFQPIKKWICKIRSDTKWENLPAVRVSAQNQIHLLRLNVLYDIWLVGE